MQNPILLTLQLIIFPGILTFIVLGFFYEWLNRKFIAKTQYRYGPLMTGPLGLFQPIADFIKLLAKDDFTPKAANKWIFAIVPILVVAVPLNLLFYIPMISLDALVMFEGDLLLILVMTTILGLLVFIGAWASTSRFSIIGGVRTGIQMLSYEIPIALVLAGNAITAQSLSLTGIVQWQASEIWLIFLQPLGFIILTICLLAELQRRPFDLPKAETELVAGWKTEYSGRKLALLRLGDNLELVFAGSLLTTLFLGGPAGPAPIPPFGWFIIKLTLVILLLSNLEAIFARFRIDQVTKGIWKYLIPLALVQLMFIQFISW